MGRHALPTRVRIERVALVGCTNWVLFWFVLKIVGDSFGFGVFAGLALGAD